jgi:putative ABC transport system permease protein
VFRIALKSTLARKGRLFLTAGAVIAGCAFLSGVFVFSDTIKASFNTLFASAYAGTDAFVRSSNVIEGDFGEESRDRLSISIVDAVAAQPGVSAAYGDVQGFARIATSDGTVLGQVGPPKYGGVFIDAEQSPWQLAEGKPPASGSEVVIDRRSAKEGKVKVGDTVSITGAGGVRDFTVSGIARFAGNDTAGGSTWALFDLATAGQFVVGQPDRIDSVIVVGDGSLDDEALATSIQQALAGSEVEVLTGAEITAENQDAIEQGLSFFTTFLTIFAALSLFVGSFIIYNVFSISAAQRQRENALLRAIGASRGQVTRVLFAEALVVGVLGGVVGFGAGVLLATGIMKLLSSIGFGPSGTELTVSPSSFVITLVVGVAVTLVCAVVPAIRSGRVPPLAALRDVSVDKSAVSRGRLVTGVVFAVIAAVGVGLGLTTDPVWLAAGVVGLFVSLVVLGPLVAAPVARLLTPALRSVRGVTGEIAARNAATSPKRTALTAGALGIGLALLVGVSTLGSSIKSSIRDTIGEQFTGDFAVSTSDAEGSGFGGLPGTLADELVAVPEVDAALGIGINLLNVTENGSPSVKRVLTLDPTQAAALLDLPFTAGGWASLDENSILVAADKAARDGLQVGSPIEASFQDGSTRTLAVAGLFDSDAFGNLIVSRSLYQGQDLPLFDAQILVSTADGVSEADAEAAIRTVTDNYPTSKVQTRSQFIADQTKQVDGFLNFIYALLLMSVFIAVLGIVITLLLAVYERRRELGLVRAIGMTRPQVRSSIRWEAFVTAVLGVVMGVGLGVSLGWIVVKALADQGLESFSVSVLSISLFAALAIVFAIIAAWWPATRAAKSDILQAIATT